MGLETALALASVAATAAGTGMSMEAANEQTNQMNDRTASTIAREEQLAKQNKPLVAQNIQASSAPKAQQAIDKSAADSMMKYQQMNSLPLTASGSSQAPNTPATIVDRERGAQTNAIQQAAAKMAGYGGWTTNQSIANQNIGNQLGVNNFNAGQIGATLPIGLSTADAGNGLAAAGQLLGTAGRLGNAYGVNQIYNNAANKYNLKGPLVDDGSGNALANLG